MKIFPFPWKNVSNVSGKQYVCGHCNNNVAPSFAFTAYQRNRGMDVPHIFICPLCNLPTFFDESEQQIPGYKYGDDVKKLPNEILNLYNEARKSFSIGAFNGVVMLTRKLLMHVSVNHGASTNLKFVEYVDYLNDNHYIPVKAKSWVDRIRKTGNIANHEIEHINETQAKDILNFTSAMLKNLYEFQIDNEED